MALPDLTDEFAADTYKGVLHTSNVPISGANLPPVYDGLGNKSSLSLGSDGNGASFTGTLSADGFSVNGTGTIIDYIYPIGSVYFTTDNTNPTTRFSGTTWTQISQGKFIVGVGTGNDGITSKNFTAGDNSGEYSHTLTTNEIPAHNHRPRIRFVSSGDDNAGSHGFLGSSPRALQDADVLGDDIPIVPGFTLTNLPTLQIENAGGGASHENTPPGFGLYVWQRTS